MVLTHLLFGVCVQIRQFHRVAVQGVSCRNIQSTATRRFRRDKQSVDATKMIDYHLGGKRYIIHRLLIRCDIFESPRRRPAAQLCSFL